MLSCEDCKTTIGIRQPFHDITLQKESLKDGAITCTSSSILVAYCQGCAKNRDLDSLVVPPRPSGSRGPQATAPTQPFLAGDVPTVAEVCSKCKHPIFEGVDYWAINVYREQLLEDGSLEVLSAEVARAYCCSCATTLNLKGTRAPRSARSRLDCTSGNRTSTAGPSRLSQAAELGARFQSVVPLFPADAHLVLASMGAGKSVALTASVLQAASSQRCRVFDVGGSSAVFDELEGASAVQVSTAGSEASGA